MACLRVGLAVAGLQAGVVSVAAQGRLQATTLRCEYKQEPLGIDVARPRLSWVPEGRPATARGLAQGAYQVLVASSPELLEAGRADLWDSGKVASAATAQVEYAGRALASAQRAGWKVRLWDEKDQPGAWSAPASWTMGLLAPADWQAQWIGFEGQAAGSEDAALKALLSFDQDAWVWTAGASTAAQPVGRAGFRKVVELPTDRTVSRAVMVLAADDQFALFVNGRKSGGGSDWKQPRVVELASRLQPGRNVLAIEVTNQGTTPSPAGLLGRLLVTFRTGDPLVVPIDGSWRASLQPAGPWRDAAFDAGAWQPAAVIARHGEQPWGKLKASVEEFRPAPCLRKAFVVAKPLKRAVLYASALGLYDLYLNGKPVGADVLAPGWTDYRKRVHYLASDVTAQLKSGPNAIGMMLGEGWYAGFLAFSGRRHYYGPAPRGILHLRLDYADGTTQVVATDASWKGADGPVLRNDLLMGSTYDARCELPGWSTAGFDDAAWQPVTVDAGIKTPLEAHPGVAMRRMQVVPAVKVSEPQPGVFVYDLGQNLVGWVRLTLQGERGQCVEVRHAEMLNPDGTLYTANLRAARATDVHYLDGGAARAYEPAFTFHGFRYVEVSGLAAAPALTNVAGIVVHSALARTGWFECSEPLVNKLVENTVWGQRGNFLDVPTDCPQRDERAGWTGDAQVFMKTACFNLDSPAFFTKWLTDLCADSQREDGAFGDVAPHISIVGFGNTGWGDAGVVCVWQMLQLYGDTRIVRQHYPALVRFMAFLERTSKDGVRGTGSYGDWLRLAGPQHSEAIGTAYYFYTTRLMAELARTIGEAADATRYEAQAARLRDVFVTKFIKPDGRIVDGKNQTAQTFYALAFGLDLVPADRRAAVAEQFAAEIAAQKGHLATGFLGTPFVLFALQKAGRSDLAYQMVLNQDYPSWLAQVKLGATTMWERWDGWLPDKGFQDAGMNSFNHYWLGCVGEWLQCGVAGIDTDGPGFARLTIRPTLAPAGKGLTRARGQYDSLRGRIASAWSVEGDRFRLEVTIPANVTATVYVPAREAAGVREGGRPAAEADGLRFLRAADGCAVFTAGSGQYVFESRL